MEYNGIEWHVFVKERYTKQINDIQERQQKQQNFAVHHKKFISEKNQWLQHREVGTLLLGNDKNCYRR